MKLKRQWLCALILLAASGCSKAEISDARSAHILAGDHGWIDLTINTVPNSTADKACAMTLTLNGETMLNEALPMATTKEHMVPIGFRFAAPVGSVDAALRFDNCVTAALVSHLKLAVDKDKLTTLEFEGGHIVQRSIVPYLPLSLSNIHEEVATLQASNRNTHAEISTLTWLAIASLSLNALIGLILLLRKARR
jgi:hypothetical protein